MGCCICQKTKTTLTCGCCQQDICKSCTEFVENDHFSFLKTIPPELNHSAFCSTCFTITVSPALVRYDALMEQARQIQVFEISQGKETRLIKRKEAQLSVADCPDRQETILRLAFLAAERGFNAIIDTDIKPKKIRDGSYQHTIWSGTAIPAQITDRQLVKDRSIWSNPN